MGTKEENEKEILDRAKLLDELNIGQGLKIEVAACSLIMEASFIMASDMINRIGKARFPTSVSMLAFELFKGTMGRITEMQKVQQQLAGPIQIMDPNQLLSRS